MKIYWFIVISLFSFSGLASPKAELDALLKESWAYHLNVNPIMATSYGADIPHDTMPDLSSEALAVQHEHYIQLWERLFKIDGSKLDRQDQINYQVLDYFLRNNIDSYTIKEHYIPITSESSFYGNLAYLPRIHQFNHTQDYENYLARLEAFPHYFRQQVEWMQKGLKSGMSQPKVVLNGMLESLATFFSGDVTDSVYYQPFINMPDRISEQEQVSLRQTAQKVISERVFEAHRRLHLFLEKRYIPRTKNNIAVTSWPNGMEFYQNRVAHFTTTDMTIDEIHQLGLDEVARIRAQMEVVIKATEFEGSLSDFIHFLRTDEQFYAKSEQELMYFAAHLSKLADGKLPKLFSVLPRTPYTVEAVPASIAPKYTTGRYISPSNETEPGAYWVNTYQLDKRPLYALPALTLHEAVPGHHLQISLASELENMPDIRRNQYISAFGEGWALYSEYLGVEVDYYTTHYQEFGRLSYEMWRAARLVVDTGMHAKGWSRQRAIDFMLDNTALSELNVKSEIDRYISWPAQALSYKIGELTIKRLRKQAQSELGDKFDVRDFHQAVLEHGSVPLSVLEQNIDIYIKETQKSS